MLGPLSSEIRFDPQSQAVHRGDFDFIACGDGLVADRFPQLTVHCELAVRCKRRSGDAHQADHFLAAGGRPAPQGLIPVPITRSVNAEASVTTGRITAQEI